MRTVLLASILLVPAAAFAAVPAASPAAAAASADPDERARQLLRAVRLKAESGAGDETALRDQAKELAAAADARSRDLATLAGSYLDLLDAGQPLPPPSPDELADAADDDPSGRAAARAQAAADSRAAAQKTAAMLDQVSGAATNPTTAASAPFDGSTKRTSVAVEVEPAPGYHTVNADDFLFQPDDASRQDVMIAATAELLAKAARKNVGGAHAISLGKALANAIAGDPMFHSMTALRVRVRPDGKLVIVYRLANGVVVEKELSMTLDEGSSVSSVHGTRRRRKRRAAAASGDDAGGDADGQGDGGGKHGHAKAPGAPDFGDGGDAGSIGAGGGSGAGQGRGEFGDGAGNDLAADDGGTGGAGDDARSGGVVDPDGAPAAGRAKRASSGAAGSGAPAVSVPGGFTTASGPGDAAPGDVAGAGADAAAAPGPRRAKGSAGAEAIPALPRLSGDLSGGRGLAAGAPALAATASASAAAATVAANNTVGTAAAHAAMPASAAPAPPVYDAAGDGPLRDAVAASPVTGPSSAKTAVAPANDAATRSAAAPAALLLASAALGGLGVFLQRSRS